ncbi:MAG TPA: flagellar biosynthetic protein FliQ [Polyangia bacterium]
MSSDLPSSLMREGFGVLAAVGGPFVIALLLVGLLVGLLQAATQINDPAVGFLPRLVTGLLMAYFTGPWVLERLSRYLAAAFRGMSGHM